jgi:hypothetical protein
MTVIGYVDLGGNAGLLYGLITNLDSRENAKESTDQTIYLPVNHISEGGELGIIIGNASVYSGTVAPKTLRFTKKAATNKMVSLSYKIKASEGFASGADVAVEISVTLSWKKALPIGL